MNPTQQELRRAAAKAFMESLDQLGQSLQSAESRPAPSSHPEAHRPEPQLGNHPRRSPVQDLEDAVADIEAFTSSRE